MLTLTFLTHYSLKLTIVSVKIYYFLYKLSKLKLVCGFLSVFFGTLGTNGPSASKMSEGEAHLLFQRVQKDPAGELEEERSVGEKEGLPVGPAKGEGCALGRLRAGSHVYKKFASRLLGWKLLKISNVPIKLLVGIQIFGYG